MEADEVDRARHAEQHVVQLGGVLGGGMPRHPRLLRSRAVGAALSSDGPTYGMRRVSVVAEGAMIGVENWLGVNGTVLNAATPLDECAVVPRASLG